MTDVTEWLNQQLAARNNMSEAELCRLGGIDSGTLSNAKARNKIGSELAKKIAKGLGAPQVVVFYQLGLIDDDPDNPMASLEPEALDMMNMLEGKTRAELQAARATLRALFEALDRGDSGRTESGNRQATSRKNAG